MTIDEAIKHCKEVAEKNENEANFGFGNACIDRSSCLECAKEHRQLVTWLEELKILKEQTSGDCISRKDIGLTNLEILMCNGDYKEALKMLLDKIKNAPSVTPQPNKWIAISKETPKKCGWYITSTIYNEVFCDYWNGDAFDRTETVLAWQEKPLPYRVESEGKKMNGSFELTLNNPLTEEDWDKIRDVELENTPSVTFKTLKGKQVKYIKADILDKIKTEIERRCCITVGEGEPAMTLYDIFQIIDKYKKESEG